MNFPSLVWTIGLVVVGFLGTEAALVTGDLQTKEKLNHLSLLEDCPVPLSANRYISPLETLQDIDKSRVGEKLRKFPSIYSHIHRHIATYETLSHAPHNDESKVNTLINLRNVIYSILNLRSDEKLKENIDKQFKFECPKRKEIIPCTCSTRDVPSLNCSAVNSFKDLKNILNNATFPSTQFTEFIYYAPNPSKDEAVLMADTFGKLSFKKMFIGGSGLKTIESGVFDGSQNTLEFLMFDGNLKMNTFPFDQNQLQLYKKLEVLSIVGCSISELPSMISDSIKYLDLNSNQLSSLDYDVFSKLPSLVMVDLSYNAIENLCPNGLYIISPDPILYFNHNKLKDISPFACHQPFLLDESHNFLTTFVEEVYKPILERNAHVDVSSNDIDCHELDWVDSEYDTFVVSDCK